MLCATHFRSLSRAECGGLSFLNTDVMLSSLVVIGLIGFAAERLVFGSIERATIYRWGMARAAKS